MNAFSDDPWIGIKLPSMWLRDERAIPRNKVKPIYSKRTTQTTSQTTIFPISNKFYYQRNYNRFRRSKERALSISRVIIKPPYLNESTLLLLLLISPPNDRRVVPSTGSYCFIANFHELLFTISIFEGKTRIEAIDMDHHHFLIAISPVEIRSSTAETGRLVIERIDIEWARNPDKLRLALPRSTNALDHVPTRELY